MLVYKLNRRQIWSRAAFSIARVGLGGFSGTVLMRSAWTADLSPIANAALALMAALAYLDVYLQVRQFTGLYILGAIRTRFISTPTALAIKAPGAPAAFLAKSECVAFRPVNHTYITSGGQYIEVIPPALAHLDFSLPLTLKFVLSHFKMWWPELSDKAFDEYVKQQFPSPGYAERIGLGILVLVSMGLSALLVLHTSPLGVVLLYPLLFQGVIKVHHLLHRRKVSAFASTTVPLPTAWAGHVRRQRREHLAGLGIADTDRFLDPDRIIVLVSRMGKGEKRAALRFILAAAAVASLFICVALLVPWPGPTDKSEVLTKFLSYALSFLGILAVKNVEGFISGSIHSAVIANRRTIAFKAGRGPIVYRKRADCVACGKLGQSLIFSDGKEYPLASGAEAVENTDPIFLKAFYDLWWPGTTLEDIKRHQKRVPQPWSIFLLKWTAICLPSLLALNLMAIFRVPLPFFVLALGVLFVMTLLLAASLDFGRSGKIRCALPIPAAYGHIPVTDYGPDDVPDTAEDYPHGYGEDYAEGYAQD